MMKNTVLLFIGSPGCGKRTLGDALKAAKIKHDYFEMGEVMRDIAKTDTHEGVLIRGYQCEGRLVPDELTLSIAKAHVSNLAAERSLLVCDGFPRTIEQTEPGIHMLRDLGFTRFVVIHITADEEICVQRLVASKRGRADDGDEPKARGRIEVFNHETLPLIKHVKTHLPELNCDFITISGNDMKRDGRRYVDGLISLFGLTPA